MTKALKIGFADLVGGGTTPVEGSSFEVQTSSQTPTIKSDDGQCRLRILSPPRLAGTTEWYEVEIQPNGSLDSAAHSPGAFEHFIALSSGFVYSARSDVRLPRPSTAVTDSADNTERMG
ncbi:hypothetical protein AmiPiv_00565 [Aminobacter sp. Piv2-1]